ncbi:MAG: cadherin-like beta sandwich domain-containing protein [Lachnospiraceae bacterium]|nr:cadherin-like beta sandwich domain-containing protein [Lachnospiraceae bacterium]
MKYNKSIKKHVHIFLVIVMFFTSICPWHSDIHASAAETGITTDALNFRSGAGTSYANVKDANGNGIVLPAGQEVEILDTKKGSDGLTWYYVSTKYNGKTYKGYLWDQYVTKKSSEPTDNRLQNNSVYPVSDGYMTGISPNTNAETFLSTLKLDGAEINKSNGKEQTGTVATGNVVSLAGNTAEIVIYGDANGDGDIGIADLVYLKKHILDKSKLKGSFFAAADIDRNGQITVADLVYLKKHVLGLEAIKQDGTSGTGGEGSESFEDQLTAQGFPDSYKEMLRTIHNIHPNWQFKAIHTGISWDTLLANEKAQKVNGVAVVRNTVWTSSFIPHYNWRSTSVGYSWATDKWTAFDGSVWFAASDDLVAYYMDPRNYLYENYIFAFESLSYHQGSQTKSGVEAILKGSFMYNTVPPGETQKYSEIIMEAAKTAKVSPYHLASRIRLEMGTTAGGAATGTSTTYPGIYNYYNIGATDGANALMNGLKWAATKGSYGRPWDTVKKSIVGGAQFLGTSYINVGQDTLYTQKFNVTNKGSLFSHQYMTNVQAPATECITNYNAYKNNNILDTAMVFKIPVYLDMPEKAVSKPADSGNPNNWLELLTVGDYELTPKFAVNKTTEYSLTVPKSVTSVKIAAKPVNGNATVSGVGTKALSTGNNVFKITVKAQNGNKRTYTLNIIRSTK